MPESMLRWGIHPEPCQSAHTRWWLCDDVSLVCSLLSTHSHYIPGTQREKAGARSSERFQAKTSLIFAVSFLVVHIIAAAVAAVPPINIHSSLHSVPVTLKSEMANNH